MHVLVLQRARFPDEAAESTGCIMVREDLEKLGRISISRPREGQRWRHGTHMNP